jgi:hypothetical protein
LGNEFKVETGNGHERDSYIAQLGIKTYFIIPPDVPNNQNQLMMKYRNSIKLGFFFD